MKMLLQIFLAVIVPGVSYAEGVNIVCNWTNSVSDNPKFNGPTTGSFTAMIDDQKGSITLSENCPNGVLGQFDQDMILINCSLDNMKMSYRINRVSGEVVFYMSGSAKSYLMHYGQCAAAQRKF